MGAFSIGQVAQLTGVSEGTLRAWERRHGLPAPARSNTNRRRYSEREVELVRRVAAQRDAGVTLSAAIERVRAEDDGALERAPSLYATLRKRWPELESRRLPQALTLALTRAMEEESLSRAERPLLFGSFQRRRFYARSRARWRQLASGAELAVVFADFPRLRTPRGGPVEVPVQRDDPLTREWAVVCDAPGHAACLVGWEPPAETGGERTLETIWSVDPEVVRAAARTCARIAGARRPQLAEAVEERLGSRPPPAAGDQLRLAAAITNRMLATLA